MREPSCASQGSATPPQIAVFPQGTPELAVQLERVGGRLVDPSRPFDAALVLGDPRTVLKAVTQLRADGFRGVIVAAGRGLGRMSALRTAGVNAACDGGAAAEIVEVLLESLENVRQEPQDPVELEYRLEPNTRRVTIGTVETVLSEVRFRLLSCLAARPGTWWRGQDLVAEAVGTHHSPDSPLIRVHMNGIRKVLGPARWCIQSERTFGYQFVTNPDALPGIGSRRPWGGAARSGVYLVQSSARAQSGGRGHDEGG